MEKHCFKQAKHGFAESYLISSLMEAHKLGKFDAKAGLRRGTAFRSFAPTGVAEVMTKI